MGLSNDLDADTALSGLPPLPGVDVAQPRRAGVRRVAAGPQRLRTAPGDQGSLLRSRSLQPAGVDGGGRSTYLDRVDPAEAPPRSRSVLRASITSAAKGRPTATRSRSPDAIPCENEVVAQLVELRSGQSAYLRRDGWIAEDEFFFAEQNARARARRRGVLPADVPRRGVVVEPPRPAHGGHARRARRAPRPPARSMRRSSCGSTTRTSATRGRRRWARAVSSTSASSRDSGTARDCLLVGLHHLRRHGHGRVGLGRPGRAQASATGARRTATRRASTRSGLDDSGSTPRRRRARRLWRAAPRARDRRDLPAPRRNAAATTSTRTWPTSSTR